MSDSIAGLRREIATAGDLQSVVRTMKALAAASVGQYEKSVSALADYYRTVELALGACLRERAHETQRGETSGRPSARMIGAVVFGSDQGLVGQFNDLVSNEAIETLKALPNQADVWAVGVRVHACLADAGLKPTKLFALPGAVYAITQLVGQLLVGIETPGREVDELHLFYNQSTSAGVYAPAHQRLLPLDEEWHRERTKVAWPNANRPEVMGALGATLQLLVREYLFISLFRACAESLTCENASRLAAMQRADRNIQDMLEQLHGTFHRLRQTGIDEELFDVISGFEALTNPRVR